MAALFSSRKFVIVFFALLALIPLVYLKIITIEQFLDTSKVLVTTLVAAIGAEGMAEKWNAPGVRGTPFADSMRPPPPAPGDVKTPAGPMRPPPMAVFALALLVIVLGLVALACVKGASVQQDPNGGVDACVEVARRCNCNLDGGGGALADVGFGR